MPPRSTRTVSPTIVVIGLLQGVLFTGLWSYFLANLQSKPILDVLMPFGLIAGLSFGMSMSLLGAWLLQIDSIRVPFENRIDFLFRMNEAAASLGFGSASRGETRLVYEPRFRLRGLAPLVVELDGRAAIIAGPQLHLVRLRRHFR